jgi:hypothetical protein
MWTQNPVWATMCGFNSHLRYLLRDKDLRRCVVSPFFVASRRFDNILITLLFRCWCVVGRASEGLGGPLILGGVASFAVVNYGIRLGVLINPVFGPWFVTGLLGDVRRRHRQREFRERPAAADCSST